MKWKSEKVEVVVRYRIGYADAASRKEAIRQIKNGYSELLHLGKREYSIKRLKKGLRVLEARP